MTIEMPEYVPEPGFYYHYKHDPNGPVENYAYEVLGLGLHTETSEFQVEYRPLYESATVFKLGKLHDHRPLAMFLEMVPINGGATRVLRFMKIMQPSVIAKLTLIRDKMYLSPEEFALLHPAA